MPFSKIFAGFWGKCFLQNHPPRPQGRLAEKLYLHLVVYWKRQGTPRRKEVLFMDPILIVEDEPAIADLIAMTLGAAGYRCETAGSGADAADLLEENRYALVFLDIMLPEIDGYELMEYIRPMGMPVIFTTAKGALKERVKGLRMGADDYIVKPFEPEELLARAEAVLRRARTGNGVLVYGDVALDPATHKVTQAGKPVCLAPREFDLLLALMRRPGVTLYREDLYEAVWGEAVPPDSRTLDLHINRLRGKLGWHKRIHTVYKFGYQLEADHETEN